MSSSRRTLSRDLTPTTQVNPGNVIEFSLFGGGTVDDAFWDISIVPQGTNNEVELIRLRTVSDFAGTRTIFFTVRNNTLNDTNFTRSAVRTPNF
jgi:hypothetical protein